MSLQVIKAPGPRVFDKIPDEVTNHALLPFLIGERGSQGSLAGEKELFKTASVCRAWRDSPFLKKDRAASLTARVERDYPEDMVKVFREADIPMDGLPFFDYSSTPIAAENLNSPVMRFEYPGDSPVNPRPGIAFKVQTKFIPNGEQSPIEFMLVMFKRYSNPKDNIWAVSDKQDIRSERSYHIQSLYNARHEAQDHEGARFEACPNCPFEGNPLNFEAVLLPLLRNQDPHFTLSGRQNPIEEEVVPEFMNDIYPVSRLHRIKAAVFGFISSLMQYFKSWILPVDN